MSPRSDAPPPPSIDALLAHRGWLRSLARGLVRDPNRADDLEQRAWLAALRSPPDRGGSLRAWLATVLQRAARDMFREDTRRQRREEHAASRDSLPSALELVERADAQRRLIEAVVALPDPYARTVLLRYFEDLAPREIARRLGVPGGTVRSRLARAHALLRERLDSDWGGRTAWCTALLPLLGPPHAPASGGALTLGVLAVKKKTSLVVALLLLLLVGAVAGSALVVPAPHPAEEAIAMEPDPVESARATPTPAATGDSAHSRRRVRPTRPTDQTGEAPPRADDASATAGPSEGGPDTAERPAPRTFRAEDLGDDVLVRRGGARGATAPRGRVVPRRGPRFVPAPERGTATFSGTVTDVNGDPLAGAVVQRVDLRRAGALGPVVSGEFLEEIATTDRRGRFEATGQPNRAFALIANHAAQMNRPRGLATRGAVRVDGAERDAHRHLEIRLPIDAGQLGALVVRVLDEEDRALRGVQLDVGYAQGVTRADGRVPFDAVRAGEVTVTTRNVEFSGYRPEERRTHVAAAGTSELELSLEPFETGPLALEGVVVDESGAPVEGTAVYLNLTKGMHGSRTTYTDEGGGFRFGNLAAAHQGRTVTVQISGVVDGESRFRAPPPVRTELPAPSRLSITVVRTRVLRVTARAAEDGTVIQSFNVKYFPVSADGVRAARPTTGKYGWDEDGVLAFRSAPGHGVLRVEAPDRVAVERAVVTAWAADPFDVVIEMQPAAAVEDD